MGGEVAEVRASTDERRPDEHTKMNGVKMGARSREESGREMKENEESRGCVQEWKTE